jgi:predicted nuclease with TOPRIM domain
MALSEFPELQVVFEKLMKEKEALVAKAKPFRDERDRLRAQMAPLEEKEREAIKKYRAIEQPRMAEIDNQLAALARATGGRSLNGAGAP